MANMHDTPSDYDAFQKKGHPGRFKQVHIVNNTTASFTGSNWGAAGIIVAESSTTGHVRLSEGGDVDLAKLTVGVQYDMSIREVACNAKIVYVLKKSG